MKRSVIKPLFHLSSVRGDVVSAEFAPFPLPMSCTSPGFGDVTNGTGEQATRKQQPHTGNQVVLLHNKSV